MEQQFAEGQQISKFAVGKGHAREKKSCNPREGEV